jgi:hypothetical protein
MCLKFFTLVASFFFSLSLLYLDSPCYPFAAKYSIFTCHVRYPYPFLTSLSFPSPAKLRFQYVPNSAATLRCKDPWKLHEQIVSRLPPATLLPLDMCDLHTTHTMGNDCCYYGFECAMCGSINRILGLFSLPEWKREWGNSYVVVR